MSLSLARPALAVLGLALVACPRPAPVVQSRSFYPPRDSLAKVAVLPFRPRPALELAAAAGGTDASSAAALVSRFVAEAVAARGIDVIPASDLETALAAAGDAAPALDPGGAALFAAREFGATGVILGEVLRYRDREGEAIGASRGASVAFQMTLYDAPSGQKLWSARFDETQQPLSANVLNAPRYPGGGTRWLSAAELARWGAGAAAETLRPSE